MTSPITPVEGACRCGRTRFEVTAGPLLTFACHCTGCQKMTSGPYSLSAAIPAAGFRVTQGEPVPGGLKGAGGHFFCGECMTWMFTRPDGVDFVNVRSPLIVGAAWSFPFVETWTRERLPWVSTPAPHSFETLPDASLWPGLMAEYAAR